jgi:ketosteroid isomerase-like protein
MSAAGAPLASFAPDRAWWGRLLAVIDARDADGFVAFLTPEAEFRFGNAPAVFGRDAIRAAVAGFFSMIGGCRHRLIGTWSGPGTAVGEGEVTYTRMDGSTVTIPFVNVFGLRGERVASYRIYIDNSPLFSKPT